MTDERYVLNVNAAGPDVVHRFPSYEECNVDDVDEVQRVDALTAAALIDKGEAVRCQHCERSPQEEPTT